MSAKGIDVLLLLLYGKTRQHDAFRTFSFALPALVYITVIHTGKNKECYF
jgi:hypothetical protein